MDEDYEQTLLVKKECFIYRIPPRPSASGYKAQDWDPSSFIWTGRLVIVARGEHCVIRFEDPNNGEIFAQCPFDQNSVEPVIDSSRYFVIRIKDGERHAFVGMGFTDRDDAFEFNATLQDHQNYIKNKKDIEIQRRNYENEPKKDYSLKTGQTIHIPFKAPTSKAPAGNINNNNNNTKKNLPVLTGTSGGGFLLSPPPPASSKTIQKPTQQNDFFSSPQQSQQQQQQQNNNNVFGNDPFNFNSSPQQQQNKNNSFDSFGDFGNFGNNNSNNNNNSFGNNNNNNNFGNNNNNNSFGNNNNNNNNNNSFGNNNNNFFSSPPQQQQQNNNQFWFN
ncbi:hypothetical protein ACTFIU_006613 [Dictyostelium citrinum]